MMIFFHAQALATKNDTNTCKTNNKPISRILKTIKYHSQSHKCLMKVKTISKYSTEMFTKITHSIMIMFHVRMSTRGKNLVWSRYNSLRIPSKIVKYRNRESIIKGKKISVNSGVAPLIIINSLIHLREIINNHIQNVIKTID